MNADYFYSLEGPLDTLPTGRQMRMAKLQGFPMLARSYGADPRAMLERYHIDPLLINDPDHYIDSKLVVDLFEYCSAAFNAPLFGLQLAQHQEPDVFGCVAALCRAASTLREAIQAFIDYIPIVHSPAAQLMLVEAGATAELRWRVHRDLTHNNQANYQAVLLDLKLLHQVGGPAFRPLYVNLALDRRPQDIDEIERRLGCRFHFSEHESAIAFPVAMLDRPVASANRLVFTLLSGYLNRVKATERTSLGERVNDYVRGALPSGNASIERCAKKLGMPVRTLQAKLSEADLKYMRILEQQRIDLAKQYLQEVRVSLDEIAMDLGYAEQSSFGRAFKRWTGTTPKLYREQFVVSANEPIFCADSPAASTNGQDIANKEH